MDGPDRRVDAEAIAEFLGISASTVRMWASRGKLARRGRDVWGRTLYDVHEALAVARRLGYGPRVTDR